MERTSSQILGIAVGVLCFLMPGILAGQDVECFFSETYAKGNLEGWESGIRQLETVSPQTFEVAVTALTGRYGYLGYLIGSNQKAKARSYLDDSEKILEMWLKKHPGHARLLAIRAAFTGFRIGLYPARAPFLGQRNVHAWEEALRNNPGEPMGWLEKGNSLFYRPAMFGGDKREAESAFRQALRVSKERPCDWIHWFILVRLYEACKANGKAAEAEGIRLRLQKQEGHFKWIESL